VLIVPIFVDLEVIQASRNSIATEEEDAEISATPKKNGLK
jgi:hypothetical protein